LLLGGEPSLELTAKLGLSNALLSLELAHLILNRRKKLAALGELSLDRCSRGGALCDEVRDLSPRFPEAGLPLSNLPSKRRQLAQSPRILLGYAIRAIDSAQEVVNGARAEEHFQRRILLARHIELDEPTGDLPLRPTQIPRRNRESLPVLADIVPNAA